MVLRRRFTLQESARSVASPCGMSRPTWRERVPGRQNPVNRGILGAENRRLRCLQYFHRHWSTIRFLGGAKTRTAFQRWLPSFTNHIRGSLLGHNISSEAAALTSDAHSEHYACAWLQAGRAGCENIPAAATTWTS